MTEEEWEALLTCITAAENSDSLSTWQAGVIAREWFDRQEWE